MNNTKRKYFYTYNLKQAEFFIKNGLVPINIDAHYTTKMVFFQFTRGEELERVIAKWTKRNK